MQLNYELTAAESSSSKGTLVLIHGLFGSLSNLGMLARAFQNHYDIIQIDLRNHGVSSHDQQMNYAVMSQDVIETLDSLGIDQFSVIGHSMGGKVAMKLTELAPNRLKNLIVLDMAPVAYQQRHHDAVFNALFAVTEAKIENRKQATEIMQKYIQENGVIQFLLKSFHQGQWKFNVDALYQNYPNIIAWDALATYNKPVLFIRGANSEYLAQPAYLKATIEQFPYAEIKIVEDAGHWLHAEKTHHVVDIIDEFLNIIE